MTEKILKPLSFFEAVKEIAIFYVKVFKHIFLLVVLASLLQAIVSALMPENPSVGLAISILSSVVAMFFYAWILYHANTVYLNEPVKPKESLNHAKKRFLPLIGVLLLYILLVAVLTAFAFALQLLGASFHIEYITIALVVLLFIFIFTLLALTMPALVLDNLSAYRSFEHSVKLVWGHWWRTFGLIIIFVVPIILLSLAVLLIPTRNILWITLYEFIFHILTYPLMISLIIVIYHDLKTRQHMVGFKHIANQPKP